MNDNDIFQVNVLELIPQRAPFVMIDCLVHFDSVMTTSKFTVHRDNLFFREDRLLASGLIENIAQTCAARIDRMSNEAVKLGFIGAVRNLKINKTPMEGETIYTTIIVKEEVFQMTLVDAIVKLNDEIIVDAEMKIALSDKDSKEDK